MRSGRALTDRLDDVLRSISAFAERDGDGSAADSSLTGASPRPRSRQVPTPRSGWNIRSISAFAEMLRSARRTRRPRIRPLRARGDGCPASLRASTPPGTEQGAWKTLLGRWGSRGRRGTNWLVAGSSYAACCVSAVAHVSSPRPCSACSKVESRSTTASKPDTAPS